jgi:signal transduction histidine kinase
VTLDLRTSARLSPRVEVTAYYVVSEALTNAAKHSGASAVHVVVDTVDGHLRLSISDDGVGGADTARGSGLVGLKDRVEALGGTLRVDSPAAHGTRLLAQLPPDGRRAGTEQWAAHRGAEEIAGA